MLIRCNSLLGGILTMFLLTACASTVPASTATLTIQPSETSSPPITFTPSPIPSPTVTPTLLPPTPEGTQEIENNDYLVYLVSDLSPQTASKPKPHFVLYDAVNDDTQDLPAGWVSYSFSLNKDNRMAFEKDGNIYVWDYPFTESIPAKIISAGSHATKRAVLSWSLDGRYLLFTEFQAHSSKLLLWDGKSVLDIYNYQGVISFPYAMWSTTPYTTWSNQGKLAFVERLINANPVSDFGEIYVWDGKDIVEVSKNPSTSPAWSKDGQLAFLSRQNGKFTISIWDGKSKNNGVPDIKTLDAPDLKLSVESSPTWTNSGSIAFIGSGKTDGTNQIYEWNGQTTRNISQTPSARFYGLAWGNDGYWTGHDYQQDSPHLAVLVRDKANRTVLETEGMESAWTQSGLLVLCNPLIGHTVSIWNGQSIVDLAHGDSVLATWTNSNGKYILCTYG
jgi:hypothetical protein